MNYEYANEQEAEPDVTPVDFFFRILGLIAIAVLICGLLAQTGCCSALVRTNIPNGEFYPATKLNYAALCFVRDEDSGAATVMALDLIPSVTTDTILLPVDLFVALKKEVYP